MAAHCSGCVFTVCLFTTHCCVCALGWVKCRGPISSMDHHTWQYITLFFLLLLYRGVASPHASSAPDSGVVTCSSRRILQIKDGGVHASMESVQQRRFSLDQSRFKRALPALLHAAPALVLQRLQQSVAAQRQGRSLRADSAALSVQRLLWEQRWRWWVRRRWRLLSSSSSADDSAHNDARARGLPERAARRRQQKPCVSQIHQNHRGDRDTSTHDAIRLVTWQQRFSYDLCRCSLRLNTREAMLLLFYYSVSFVVESGEFFSLCLI